MVAWVVVSGSAFKQLGRYTLHEPIASGGMATVHLGRLEGPVGFAKTVAIKRLRDDLASSQEGVVAFLDEARLTARIQHPNVVSILDALSADGEIYLVMEFVRGASLAMLQRRALGASERIPLNVASAVVLGALHGLHAAHEATGEDGQLLGIIHRDVSPQNVMVGVDGVPRLLDFGVAKAVWRLQTTDEGQVKGKIAYMAPEQVTADATDRRADIFSMGVVLWELCTGGRLFQRETPAATMRAVLEDAAPRPSSLVGDLSPALDAVLARALAKDPDQRFPTARDFAVALEAAVAVASQLTVGEYVQTHAGDHLRAQAQALASVSGRASAAELSTEDVPTKLESHSGTTGREERTLGSQSALVHSRLPPAGRWSPLRYAAVAVVSVLAVTAISWVWVHRATSLSSDRSATPKPSEPPAALATSPSTSAVAAQPSAASGATVLGDTEDRLDAAPKVASSAAPRPPAPSRPAPTPKAKPKKKCDPPYVIDENGYKRYLPECF